MNNLGALGTAYVEIGADLSNLERSLSNAVQDGAQAAQKIGASFDAGLSKIQLPTAQLDLFSDSLGSISNEARQMGLAFHESTVLAVSSADSMGGAFRGTGGYVDNLKVAFSNLGAAVGAGVDRLEQFRPSLNQFGSAATQLGTSLSVGVTLPLVGLAAASIKAFSDIDSLKRGLLSVAGSADEAEAQFADMIEVAKLPGLGLEEAVKGSIRLQAFGFSASQSKEALLAFGNAIATVGGGKSELDRVIVQLGQMAGAGKILQQDLRPIIEQVPQVAGIIKKSFGEEAIGQPEKALERLGISSQQFIKILVSELGKLPKVTGGIKNDLENFADAATRSFSDIGSAIAPAVHVISDALTPAMQGVAKTFADLPGAAQGAVIGIGAVAAAAGPAVFILGSLAQSVSALIEVTQVLRGLAAAEWFLTTAGAVGVLGGALGGLAFGTWLADMQSARPPVEELETRVRALGISVDDLKKKMADGGLTAEQYATHLANVLRQKGESAGGNDKSAQERMNDAMLKSIEIIPTLDGKIQALHRSLGIQDDSYKKLTDSEKELDIQMMEHNLQLQKQNTAMLGSTVYIEPYSKGVKELVTKHKELVAEYNTALAVETELHKLQAAGANVAGELALAHDKVTKAFNALNPQIKENANAQKAATAALKADTEERNKQDDLLEKLYNEAAKNLKAVEEAQRAATKAGQDDVFASKQLQDAKDALSTAFNNLNRTVHENATEQIAANAGTKQAVDVGLKQADQMAKVKDAARGYVTAIQEATHEQTLHQIAATGTFDTMVHGVAVFHEVSASMQQAAKDGTLTWAQVQKATAGTVESFKMVPDAITGVMTAIEILRGSGVQKIQTLADTIGGLKTAFLSVTDALNGTQSAVPQWVLNNTVAIVNGVHIVSDAAKALFADNAELAKSQEKVAGAQQEVNEVMIAGQKVMVTSNTATSSATSAERDLAQAAGDVAAGFTKTAGASGAAVAGINKVAAAARAARNAFDVPSTATGPGWTNQGDPGFSMDAPINGSGGLSFSTDRQTIINTALALYQGTTAWAAAAQMQYEDYMAAQVEMGKANMAAAAAANENTASILNNTNALVESTKQSDAATPTLSDLTDQLWRLIDAGQGSSGAAWELRSQISALGSTANVVAHQVSNAYSDATAAAVAFGTAVTAVATTTVQAAAATVDANNKARTAVGLPEVTVPGLPSTRSGPAAGTTSQEMVNQGGMLVVAPATNIYIQAQSPESIGAEVTAILRRGVFQ